MKRFMGILILIVWVLIGCTRHYHLYVIGNNHDIELAVSANVPKQIETSPTLELDVAP